jgi:cytochrome o ubiquinol oxidase subunit 3
MGLSESYHRRLFCFSLFWHVLDVVWIAIFTFVYLLGVQP